MGPNVKRQKFAIIKQVLSEIERLTGRKVPIKLDAFVRQFYANSSLQDMAEKEVTALAGEAASIWSFLQHLKSGETKVRVFNPDLSKHGWESNRTTLEVISSDMPFLVDSVTAKLSQIGIIVHMVTHPVVRVCRDAKGKLKDIVKGQSNDDGVTNESLLSFEISQQATSAKRNELQATIKSVLDDVRFAVEDWRAMRERVLQIITELKIIDTQGAGGDIVEAEDFLQWAHDNNFTFLGYRDYNFKGTGAKAKVHVDPKTGLGILRDSKRLVLNELRHLDFMPTEVRSFINRPDPIVVSKADMRSTVHRPVLLDTIGIKKFNAAGKVVGQHLIVGLFTSVAYNSSPRDIPLLRRKIDKTIARTGFPPSGHDGKALMNILETYPRDELFQTRIEDLIDISIGILHLQERQRTALFIRHDDFGRFVSCLVFVPRDQYNTGIRLKVMEVLADSLGGEVSAFSMEFTESPFARLHVTITTPGGARSKIKSAAIEQKIADLAKSWPDHLGTELTSAHGEDDGNQLRNIYNDAFPPSYRESFDAAAAVEDISRLEQVVAGEDLNLQLYRPANAAKNEVRFKVFHPHMPLPLSDVLPMLEDMGLRVIDEVPHAIRLDLETHQVIMIHDFGLVSRNGAAIDIEAVRQYFHEVFSRVWHGDMESDGFNALVLEAGLSWRQIVILRTYAKYLRQAKAPFSQDYMERTLANNPAITRNIVKFFETNFDPAAHKGRNRNIVRLRQKILDSLNKVESADEDRILRRYQNAVESSLRTNFYQSDSNGNNKPYLAIKFDSRKLEELPLPRPLREIFVYSPRFEAIHLRGGMVARGGLRWSDRPEDFRTEILGLMKAQMVKNAVIVPVGSKGGFVVKQPPKEGDREAFIEEGITCYKMFMGGLLDITDNLKGPKLIPPKDVIRLDTDDPYLVVAADKGTATFSDIANGVSNDYGFWLGDAYASGGSIGYDHKKMGITARGAWESVKRHFREIGKDIQKEDFSVVGVGDMSGDVFGNGMLLSKHIKLLGAFNHLQIFVDPDPDPAKSFAERKRMFNLARSSWSDYNTDLISKGGGIFERSAKSITLTPQIKKCFGISKSQLTPNELIKIILTAKVELLWFGGIGTYIKASTEVDADAGDRANDPVRINANQLNCQVIGEGANLGVTQRARIEFGLLKGRLNTDSVDNSAGVDCSDHEVNIKILLNSVVAKGKLTQAQRNKLLAKMTGEVGDLVLRDNYLQTQAITLVEAQDIELLDHQTRFMRFLERKGRLDRAIEFLPDEETLIDREKGSIGLTRPEISIIIPYAKLWLYDMILDSDLADDANLRQDLIDYFPTPLRAKYRNDIFQHRLKREIIATVVTNSMINRVGGTFVTNMMEKSGAEPIDIARAYIATRDAFGLEDIWAEIETLDNKVDAAMQVTLLKDVNKLIERSTLWFLRNARKPIDIGANIKEFSSAIKMLAGKIERVAPESATSRVNFRVNRYARLGVPQDLARRVAYLILLVSSLDIVRTSASCKMGVEDTAGIYFEIGESFGLGWLRYNAEKLPGDNYWQKLASAAVIEELYGHQKGITAMIMSSAANGSDPLVQWSKINSATMDQTKQMLNELESAEQVDLSMLAVVSRHLGSIIGTTD